MPYAAKDYSKLIGIEGFSETLLKNHFTLYQGYVTNTNKVLDTLDQMLKDGKTGTLNLLNSSGGSAGNLTGCGFTSIILRTSEEKVV